MGFELDHVLIVTEPGAAVAERLHEAGLTEGSPNSHPGQGTANRRFFFGNAMLELIYVVDEAEARSPIVAPTRLWERSRWRMTGASPFGVCLRTTGNESPPFPTFDYSPAYLPEGVAIPIARGTMAVEAMIFVNPVGERPDRYPLERREPLDHAAGVREITGVTVQTAGCELSSDPLRAVERLGIATFTQGDSHLLTITFDNAVQNESADLRPKLPLVLRW